MIRYGIALHDWNIPKYIYLYILPGDNWDYVVRDVCQLIDRDLGTYPQVKWVFCSRVIVPTNRAREYYWILSEIINRTWTARVRLQIVFRLSVKWIRGKKGIIYHRLTIFTAVKFNISNMLGWVLLDWKMCCFVRHEYNNRAFRLCRRTPWKEQFWQKYNQSKPHDDHYR